MTNLGAAPAYLAALDATPDGLWMVLIVITEGGRVPYCKADNPRGRIGLHVLGDRFLGRNVARVVRVEELTPANDPIREEHAMAQMVLAHALAMAEAGRPGRLLWQGGMARWRAGWSGDDGR